MQITCETKHIIKLDFLGAALRSQTHTGNYMYMYIYLVTFIAIEYICIYNDFILASS